MAATNNHKLKLLYILKFLQENTDEKMCIRDSIRCNFNNIAKISNIFAFKWTEVTIDSVKEGSSLLEFVKVQGLKYFIRHHSSGNIERCV